ncbi:MAG: aminomethyl-transferring glycine dehydrogenase subunit GcvPB [Deltaproteobacteria bacterium]|nr:aminomethyl-transferring glycine dehydrogenase subunit GcvPB [Deltaproteobacteria bacterium]
MSENTVYQKSKKGRMGYSFDTYEVDHMTSTDFLPENLVRKTEARLPELSEFDVVRHYTRLSKKNYSIDTHFYPLGSCTMKYNPRINEETAAQKGFSQTHPMQYQYTVQGNLCLIYELGEALKQITGMDGVSLQPCAGAHGELTGLLMIRACLTDRGNPRKKIITPDSAHGTNPASAAMCGYGIVSIKTGEDGFIDPAEVQRVMNEDCAGIMITNPSTLGIFEKNIKKIADIVHAKGGLVYMDGANLNAVVGQISMADLGVDCLHINLHKTFSTPHGGGGPGAGPVVVNNVLEPYLPVPVISKDKYGRYFADYNREKTIGRMRVFLGNFAILVRAYTYIRELGLDGIKKVSKMAVLNANYIRARLKDHYQLKYDSPSLHEVVFSDATLKGTNVKTIDVAKRIIDYGFHPPTVYFPIIVPGAIMIEPTETESKETIDDFCDAMIKIAAEIKNNPEKIIRAPETTCISRLDEVKAVKEPVLRERF